MKNKSLYPKRAWWICQGKPHPRLGLQLSDEHKEKLRRKRLELNYTKERHPNWKGGCKTSWMRWSHQVWEDYWHEKILKGYVLHHMDGNYENIDIWNLAMVTKGYHKTMQYRHYHDYIENHAK